MKTVSSKSLRKERRIKALKAFLAYMKDTVKIGVGIVIGFGMLWIIQVGVTSI